MSSAYPQYRYTSARRTLERSSPGFGTVMRSAAWPADLTPRSPQLASLLGFPETLRASSAATGSVTEVDGRRLLAVKRTTGDEPQGRPGNYLVLVLAATDASLGPVDLATLLVAGQPDPWDTGDQPIADGPGLGFEREAGWALVRKASGPVADDATGIVDAVRTACETLPAAEVNRGTYDGSFTPAPLDADTGDLYARAARTGAARLGWWWAPAAPADLAASCRDHLIDHADVDTLSGTDVVEAARRTRSVAAFRRVLAESTSPAAAHEAVPVAVPILEWALGTGDPDDIAAATALVAQTGDSDVLLESARLVAATRAGSVADPRFVAAITALPRRRVTAAVARWVGAQPTPSDWHASWLDPLVAGLLARPLPLDADQVTLWRATLAGQDADWLAERLRKVSRPLAEQWRLVGMVVTDPGAVFARTSEAHLRFVVELLSSSSAPPDAAAQLTTIWPQLAVYLGLSDSLIDRVELVERVTPAPVPWHVRYAWAAWAVGAGLLIALVVVLVVLL